MMNFTEDGKRAYEVCFQHYVERGNTYEEIHRFLDHLDEEYILCIAERIQEEQKMEPVAIVVDWKEFHRDKGKDQ